MSSFILEAERIFKIRPAGAEYVYGYLSVVTHPSVFGYLEFLSRDDAVFCAKLSCYAVLAFYNSLRCFHGWTQSDIGTFPEGDSIKKQYEILVEHYQKFT